eukprot:7590766-Pyramimonas_sp.AAC.1
MALNYALGALRIHGRRARLSTRSCSEFQDACAAVLRLRDCHHGLQPLGVPPDALSSRLLDLRR